MKYYYYSFDNGSQIGSGAYSGEFFNWEVIKKYLSESGAKNAVCTFFKEITEEEHKAFMKAFTK